MNKRRLPVIMIVAKSGVCGSAEAVTADMMYKITLNSRSKPVQKQYLLLYGMWWVAMKALSLVAAFLVHFILLFGTQINHCQK